MKLILWIALLTLKPVDEMPKQEIGPNGFWNLKGYCTQDGTFRIGSKTSWPMELVYISTYPHNLAELEERHPCWDATQFKIKAEEGK